MITLDSCAFRERFEPGQVKMVQLHCRGRYSDAVVSTRVRFIEVRLSQRVDADVTAGVFCSGGRHRPGNEHQFLHFSAKMFMTVRDAYVMSANNLSVLMA